MNHNRKIITDAKHFAEVNFATIPCRKTIQLLLPLSLFSSIGLLLTVPITFTHHREGRLGSVLGF